MLCRFLRSPLTEAPSLPRRYPASSVLQASPSPQTARPVPRGLSVDPTTITAGASRVASGLLCLHAVAITPAGAMKPIRSCFFIVGGLPRVKGGSAPAITFSRPAQRSLTLRPARSRNRQRDPFHRRLQRLRYLYRCFDCYRVERTSSRAGLAPAGVQRLFTAHFHARYGPASEKHTKAGTGARRQSPVPFSGQVA